MRLFISMVMLLSFSFIGGCSLHEAKGEVGGVEVEVKNKDGGSGDFCPPGQAKKGNC